MSRIQKELGLGEKITVQTIQGRGTQIISRLPDGRVALFDQNSPYFDLLAPDQEIECHVIVVQDNYVIVSPINPPVKIEVVHIPGFHVDDIVEDLEKMIKKLSGNAEVIPRALLRIIRLQQLQLKILMGEA